MCWNREAGFTLATCAPAMGRAMHCKVSDIAASQLAPLKVRAPHSSDQCIISWARRANMLPQAVEVPHAWLLAEHVPPQHIARASGTASAT